MIGYDTRHVYENSILYNKLINAYKIRYINKIDYAKTNIIYDTILKHLYKNLLTKN